MVVQVNGKVRDRIDVDAGITEEDATAAALGLRQGQRGAARCHAGAAWCRARPAWSTSWSEGGAAGVRPIRREPQSWKPASTPFHDSGSTS